MSESTITTIAQATDTLAGYAGKKPEDDFLVHVLCWAVVEYDDGSPSEVIGEVFDDGAIQEATVLEDEYDATLVGYFKDNKEGRSIYKMECEEYRNRKKK